ncbi:MAG: hypothetical protein HY769_04420 [Candidatus Stahlbacteria bacterium]|nr:hypothetical protein [Candidatus Stahlbacteria bacterium]
MTNINERKFDNWDELPTGRRYWYEVRGKFGYTARYIKEVDKQGRTNKFYQEIYDSHGNLVEVHEKFPVDKGHRIIRR